MPCIHYEVDVVCAFISRKGRCKKMVYPEGHPFCAHDRTLLTLKKQQKKGKKKLNWKHYK